MKLKKLTSVATALALTSAMFFTTGFTSQATALSNGSYTADVIMMQYYQPASASMCAGLFAAQADIEVSGEYSEVTLYIVSPLPGFEEDSAIAIADGGIMKDTILTINGTEYAGTYNAFEDINKINRLFDKDSSPLFGITAGAELDCDSITIVVPTASLNGALNSENTSYRESYASNTIGDGWIQVSSYVNVVMKSTQSFWMALSNYEVDLSDDLSDEPSDETTTPSQSETRSAMITATVPSNTSSFTVTVPESIDLDELSYSEDTSVDYSVEVTFQTVGNDGLEVQVETESNGVLTTTDGDELAFSDNFGQNTFAATGSEDGTVTVKSDDVSNAVVGDYTGTLSFVITTMN